MTEPSLEATKRFELIDRMDIILKEMKTILYNRNTQTGLPLVRLSESVANLEEVTDQIRNCLRL